MSWKDVLKILGASVGAVALMTVFALALLLLFGALVDLPLPG